MMGRNYVESEGWSYGGIEVIRDEGINRGSEG